MHLMTSKMSHSVYKPDDKNKLDFSIYPKLSMNSKEFLHKIYNIISFDDLIEWMKNNDHYTEETKNRIHNCAWKSFANKINNDIVDFYYNIMIEKWFDLYIKKLNEYFIFGLKNDNFFIDKLSENSIIDKNNSNIYLLGSSNKEKTIIIYNEIRDKFMNYPIFYKSIKEFISVNNPEFVKSNNYYFDVRKYIYDILYENITKYVDEEYKKKVIG